MCVGPWVCCHVDVKGLHASAQNGSVNYGGSPGQRAGTGDGMHSCPWQRGARSQMCVLMVFLSPTARDALGRRDGESRPLRAALGTDGPRADAPSRLGGC